MKKIPKPFVYHDAKRCTVTGCKTALYARAICKLHYARLMRNGTTDALTHSADISGQRFGRLVALNRALSKNGQSRWRCRCDCQKETVVWLGSLTTGRTKSCGCLRFDIKPRLTHGQSHTPLFASWLRMKGRCNNPNNQDYPLYGGRGIKVCERWNDYVNFAADMGQRPAGMQIDRIDNDGPYSPENCRWATNAENSRNRRSTIRITINGKTQCLTDWCNERGIVFMWARYRIKELGWSPEKALGFEHA